MAASSDEAAWSPAEQLILVEAVHKYGRGVVLDFTRIGREVRAAVALLATQNSKKTDFFGSRKCENKWRELLHAQEAQKGVTSASATRGKRKEGDPTPADRAVEMMGHLRDARVSEIKAQLATVKEQIMETEKELTLIDSAPQATLDKFYKAASVHPELHLMDPKSILGRAGSIPLIVSKNEAAAAPAQAARPAAPALVAAPATPASAPAVAPAAAPAAAAPAVKDEPMLDTRKAPASAPVQLKASTPAASPAPGVSAAAAALPSSVAGSEPSESEELPVAVVKKRHEQFGKVWKTINAHEKAEPFKKPVTKREAPDYHTVIKRPIALNDVKKRVDKSDYEGSIKDFFGDMKLIFENAMQYNTKGSDIWNWANELLKLVQKEEKTMAAEAAADKMASEAVAAPTPKSAGRLPKKGTDTPEVVEEPTKKRRRGGAAEEEEEPEAEAKGGRSRRQAAAPSATRKRRRDND